MPMSSNRLWTTAVIDRVKEKDNAIVKAALRCDTIILAITEQKEQENSQIFQTISTTDDNLHKSLITVG